MAIIRVNGQGASAQAYAELYKTVKTTINAAVDNGSLPSMESAHVISRPATEDFSDIAGFSAKDVVENFNHLNNDLRNTAIPALSRYSAENFGEGNVLSGADLNKGRSVGYATEAMAANGDKQASLAVAILAQSFNKVRSYYASESASVMLSGADVTPALVTNGLPVVPQWAAEEIRESIATESFDEKVTDQWRYHSYAIAMSAAKQSEFGSLWYRTQMLTPDNAGFILSIRRNVCWDGYMMSDLAGGKIAEDLKTNINVGLLDYTVTETETVELKPVVRPGVNDMFFVDPTLVAPQPVDTQGTPYNTNFLTFTTNGEGGNLIALGQTPDRLQKGTPNQTDSLDSYFAIGKVLVKVTNADGSKKEVFEWDVEGTPGATFLAARESNFRNSDAKFWPRDIRLTVDQKTQAHAASELLAAAQTAGLIVQLGFNIDGRVNHEFGNYEVTGSNTHVAGVLKRVTEGENSKLVEVDVKSSEVTAALAGLKFEVYGWSPVSRLTNINQLEMGKRIDSDMMKFGFMIPTLSPITIQKPAMVEDDKTYPKMEAMQAYYRLQIRNAAVTSLLNRADTMLKYLGNDQPHDIESVPQLEGLGQYYVKSYYLEDEIDVLKDLNSLRSDKKVVDIQGLITSRMQEAVSRADQLTGYSSILKQEFGENTKAHVAIGTDLRLPLYMMTQGDDRTLGINYNFTIASVSDLRMKNLIFMSFTLPNQSEIHPLDFGILGMIPEYIVNFMNIREQRVATEIRLTPRYRFFHFLPILIKFTVKNLEAAIAARTALDVNTTTTGGN